MRWLEAPIFGSSPLARGTPGAVGSPYGAGRFIPAGAGNTHRRPVVCERVSVHPRWRGEHRVAMLSVLVVLGSSPLARGTHLA